MATVPQRSYLIPNSAAICATRFDASLRVIRRVLLQEADRLVLLPRSHQPVQLHLPLGIDPRSSGVQPFHPNLAVRDAAGENPASVVRVVRLLVPDEFVNHGVDVIRLELVPQCGVLGLYRLPDVAVALPGMVEPDALVPGDVGEEQGDVGRLRRRDAAGVAQQRLRHFLHDLGHFAWLFRHRDGASAVSCSTVGEDDRKAASWSLNSPGQPLLQSGQRLGQRVAAVVLEDQPAVVHRTGHEPGLLRRPTSIQPLSRTHRRGRGTAGQDRVGPGRQHDDGAGPGLPHLPKEVQVHFLQFGEVVSERDLDAEFVQVREQLFPARVAPEVNAFGAAGLIRSEAGAWRRPEGRPGR